MKPPPSPLNKGNALQTPTKTLIIQFRLHLSTNNQTFQHIVHLIISTRNGKVIWNVRLNKPFYALMSRTKLYQNPFFSTLDQNVNKLKNRPAKTVFIYIYLHIFTFLLRKYSSLIFCQELTSQQLGDRHPNPIELAGAFIVRHNDYDIKNLQSPLNTSWKYILLIYFTFLVKALPQSLHYILGIYIYSSLVIHFY